MKSIQFCKQIGLILTTNNQIYNGTIASWEVPSGMVENLKLVGFECFTKLANGKYGYKKSTVNGKLQLFLSRLITPERL